MYCGINYYRVNPKYCMQFLIHDLGEQLENRLTILFTRQTETLPIGWIAKTENFN